MKIKKEAVFARETPDGRLTLLGTYEKLIDYIRDVNEWKAESTCEGHDERFKNTILPAVKDHDLRPIGSYDRAAVDGIVVEIARAGQSRGRGKTKIPYEAKTLAQFRTILEEIVEAAADNFLCPPLEKDTKRRKPIRKDENLVVRRFLRPEEVADFLIQIIADLETFGEARLALVSYATGLRPSECAGLNWGMLLHHPETDVRKLNAAQTAIPGTSRTKLRMKTGNGHRVALPDGIAYKLLMKVREKLLARWCAEGQPAELFDQSPLGAKGNSLTQRCSYHHLSKYINRVFLAIGIRWEEMAALAEDLDAEYEELEACGYDVDIHDYSSPGFYLLRHLFATESVPLLDLPARQYFQGHKVDDLAISRRIYTSSAVQQIIQSKRRERPLLNPLEDKIYTLDPASPLRVNGYAETIVVPPGMGSVVFEIDAEEPGDIISVSIDCEGFEEEIQMQVWKCWQDPPEDGFSKRINVLRFYHDLYRPAQEKLLRAFPDLYA